jgi:hypothetical protein
MKTHKLSVTSTLTRNSRFTARLGFYALLGLASLSSAQTIVSGPNVSGTWSPSGNPYYVTGNCTVQSADTLTIQPGVIVDIGAGVSITANGTIQAVGTPSQRITFQSFIPSEFWNTITVNGTANTNLFIGSTMPQTLRFL